MKANLFVCSPLLAFYLHISANFPFRYFCKLSLFIDILFFLKVLRFSDLKKLGPSKWIVTEFQFLHNNENAHMFKCDLCIAPTLQNGFVENSAFTSQEISIVKKFSRSEV